MVSAIDTAMGLLLGISAFLLVLSLLSYRRSGVRSMLLLSEGLAVHLVFTSLLISVAYVTDWLDKIDGTVMVMVDAIVLMSVILLGYFGGRPGAGPP